MVESLCFERGIMDMAVVALKQEEVPGLVEVPVQAHIATGLPVLVCTEDPYNRGNIRLLPNKILFVSEPPAASAIAGQATGNN